MINATAFATMTAPCFIVICRDDDQHNGEKGDYLLATRCNFSNRGDAAQYARGIATGREPIVVECPNGLTYTARESDTGTHAH